MKRRYHETLESRRMMAIDFSAISTPFPGKLSIEPSAYVGADNVLRVVGSTGDDDISIDTAWSRAYSWNGSSWSLSLDERVRVTVRDRWTSVVEFQSHFDADQVVSLRIDAYAGNDLIRNTRPLRSLIYAGDGNDTVYGGSDADRIYGQQGIDTLYGNDGADYLDGGTEDDTMFGDPLNSTRAYADVMYGGDGRDTMYGGAGNDTMDGGNGNDTMLGGAGRDTMYGRSGDDDLDGSYGDDTLYGGGDNDDLFGGLGDDWMYGDGGVDHLFGDGNMPGQLTDVGAHGNDRLYGGSGSDTLMGQGGNDIAYGNSSNDTIEGGDGNDWLFGGDGHDTIKGDAGDDYIWGENGNDTLDGGTEVDRIYGGNDRDLLFGGPGEFIDYLYGDAGNDDLDGGSGNDYLYGGTDDDLLKGNFGNDYLYGEAGDDTLYGNNGGDYLNGGDGNDGLYGGDNFDRLRGGNGADRFLTDGDAVYDVTNVDAHLQFVNAPAGWFVSLGGLRYTAPGVWTANEIELLDQAFGALMARTGNTDLLKMPNGDNLAIIRRGPASWGAEVNGVNHLDGNITLGQGAFVNESWAAQTLIHEIAHNWQREPFFDAFREAHLATDADDFHTEYASTNAEEDLGETLAFAVIDWANQNVDSLFWADRNFQDDFANDVNHAQVRNELAAKLRVLDDFFAMISR